MGGVGKIIAVKDNFYSTVEGAESMYAEVKRAVVGLGPKATLKSIKNYNKDLHNVREAYIAGRTVTEVAVKANLEADKKKLNVIKRLLGFVSPETQVVRKHFLAVERGVKVVEPAAKKAEAL